MIPELKSDRALIAALFLSLGGNSGMLMLGTRGQDRVVEQLDRIAETLAATKSDLAGLAAGVNAQLLEHSRRLERIEMNPRSRP